jgi:hypothetical protein
MHAFLQFYPQKKSGFLGALSSGILILGLMSAAPAAYAGMGGGAGAAAGAGAGAAAGAGGGGAGAGAAAGAGGGGAGTGGGAAGAAGGGGGAGGGGTVHRQNDQTELTICPRGMVLNTKDRTCLAKHSGVRRGARVD